jgi:predicted DNA-binding transcriptional regulator AlpA
MNHLSNTRQRPLLGSRAALAYCGNMGKSTRHRRILAGTFPKGVTLGPQARAWFQDELDAWNAAVARGATDDELRALSAHIEAARMQQAA